MQVPAPNKLKYFANHVPVDGRSRAMFRLFLNAVNLFRIEGRSKVDRPDELVLRTSFVCNIRRLRSPPWIASFPFVTVCFSSTTSKVHGEIHGEVRSHATSIRPRCSHRVRHVVFLPSPTICNPFVSYLIGLGCVSFAFHLTSVSHRCHSFVRFRHVLLPIDSWIFAPFQPILLLFSSNRTRRECPFDREDRPNEPRDRCLFTVFAVLQKMAGSMLSRQIPTTKARRWRDRNDALRMRKTWTRKP